MAVWPSELHAAQERGHCTRVERGGALICGIITVSPQTWTYAQEETAIRRKELPWSWEAITPFDLEAFMHKAAALNQRNAGTSTTPFPTAPHRWISHDHFTPRPITCTAAGEVEGGLSWLIGAVIDFPDVTHQADVVHVIMACAHICPCVF